MTASWPRPGPHGSPGAASSLRTGPRTGPSASPHPPRRGLARGRVSSPIARSPRPALAQRRRLAMRARPRPHGWPPPAPGRRAVCSRMIQTRRMSGVSWLEDDRFVAAAGPAWLAGRRQLAPDGAEDGAEREPPSPSKGAGPWSSLIADRALAPSCARAAPTACHEGPATAPRLATPSARAARGVFTNDPDQTHERRLVVGG